MFRILVKIAMFARLVLGSEATKLNNIWHRGSSIPIFLRGGFSFLTKNLSMSIEEPMEITEGVQWNVDLHGVSEL